MIVGLGAAGRQIGVHVTAIDGLDFLDIHLRLLCAAVPTICLNGIGEFPVLQAVVGDKEVHTRHGIGGGILVTSHREVVLVLHYRQTVMNDAVNLALHHLAVEVKDVRTRLAAGGAELLEQLGKRYILTEEMLLVNLFLENHVGLLAGLTLAQEEEAVVLALGGIEYGTHLVALTDAQTVGQQLDGLDVSLKVSNDGVLGIVEALLAETRLIRRKGDIVL